MEVRTPGLCSYRQINGGEHKYPELEVVLSASEVGKKGKHATPIPALEKLVTESLEPKVQ